MARFFSRKLLKGATMTNLEKIKSAIEKMDATTLAIFINDLKYVFRLETYADFLRLIAYLNGSDAVEHYGRFDGTHCIGFGIKQESEEK